jgi:hypothetical protein
VLGVLAGVDCAGGGGGGGCVAVEVEGDYLMAVEDGNGDGEREVV